MKKLISYLLFIFTSLSLSTWANAQSKYIEGKDYTILEAPIDRLSKDKTKPEVLEIFSYSCPHCRSLHPVMHKWETKTKDSNTNFFQIPALGGNWELVGQAKLVADKFGLGYDFDTALFDAIHKEKKRYLIGDKKKLQTFIATFAKVDIEAVEKAWKSLQVKKNAKRAHKIWQQGQFRGVPTIVVNGKYIVESRDSKELPHLLNFLSLQP